MTLATRIKLILEEKHIKQIAFAESLGISANYVSLLINGKKMNISDTLAKLIEEAYGYSSEWVLYGTGNKYISDAPNSAKLETIKKIKKMSDSEINALLAFIDSMDNIKSIYTAEEDQKKESE